MRIIINCFFVLSIGTKESVALWKRLLVRKPLCYANNCNYSSNIFLQIFSFSRYKPQNLYRHSSRTSTVWMYHNNNAKSCIHHICRSSGDRFHNLLLDVSMIFFYSLLHKQIATDKERGENSGLKRKGEIFFKRYGSYSYSFL